MHNTDRKFEFKILVIGDPEVGKTSLIRKFTENKFNASYLPTIGIDFSVKLIALPDMQVITTIWDIGGQESFNFIRETFYKGVHGGIIVFDLTRKETFDTVEKWAEDIRKNTSEKIPLILIGNKIDLRDKIDMNMKEIENISVQLEMPYFLVSVKSGLNVTQAFEKIAFLTASNY